jgi:hypothetical protein
MAAAVVAAVDRPGLVRKVATARTLEVPVVQVQVTMDW